jgi:tetratricopeptide (TPR) repeat protein
MTTPNDATPRRNWLWLTVLIAVLGALVVSISSLQKDEDGAQFSFDDADSMLQGFTGGSLTGEYLVGYYAQRSKDLDMAADAFAAAVSKEEGGDKLRFTAMHTAVLAGRVEDAVTMAREFAEANEKIKTTPPKETATPDTHPQAEEMPEMQEVPASTEAEAAAEEPSAEAPASQQDAVMARYVSILGLVHDKQWVDAAQEISRAQMLFSPFQKLMFDITHAWVLQAQGRTDEALAQVDKLSGLDRRSMLIAYQRALILTQAKRFDEADTLFEEMLSNEQLVMPRRVVEVYAASLHARGQQDKARQLVAKYDDKSTLLWQEIADLNAVAGVKNPGYLQDPAYGVADLLYGIASLARQQGSSEAAIQFLQLALYLEPDYDAARVFLAAIWSEQRMFERAIAEYAGIGKKSPYWLHSQLNMAGARANMEQFEEAASLLRALSKQFPDHASVWLHLGDTLRRHEQFKEAAEAYSSALAKMEKASNDERWPILYMRGICYERSKQWPKAEMDFKKALELSPDQPDVLNYLGYSWLDMGLNTEEAKEMVEKAVDQRPLDAHILDSMGWAYFRLGQYEDALDYIMQSIELMPTDPIVTHHYADVLWHLGRKREAEFEWQRALLFNPTPEDKAVLEQKIEKGYIAPKARGSK